MVHLTVVVDGRPHGGPHVERVCDVSFPRLVDYMSPEDLNNHLQDF